MESEENGCKQLVGIVNRRDGIDEYRDDRDKQIASVATQKDFAVAIEQNLDEPTECVSRSGYRWIEKDSQY